MKVEIINKILFLNLNSLKIKKNIVIDIKPLTLLALSPVTKIENKKIIANKKIIYFLLDLYLFKQKPNKINKKAYKYDPTTASFLKKL